MRPHSIHTILNHHLHLQMLSTPENAMKPRGVTTKTECKWQQQRKVVLVPPIGIRVILSILTILNMSEIKSLPRTVKTQQIPKFRRPGSKMGHPRDRPTPGRPAGIITGQLTQQRTTKFWIPQDILSCRAEGSSGPSQPSWSCSTQRNARNIAWGPYICIKLNKDSIHQQALFVHHAFARCVAMQKNWIWKKTGWGATYPLKFHI